MIRSRRPILLFTRLRDVVAPKVAPPLAAVLLLFSVGCLSTNVQVRPGGDASTSGVLVRVYATPDAVKEGRPNAYGTLVELYRLERDGKETFLQRSLASEWGVDGLPPGRYRLKVPAVVDAGGNIRETRSGDRETDVSVQAGQTAEVRIILRKTPAGLIVAASITVVLLVVAAALLMSDHHVKIPAPPIPPPDLLLPPPILVHPVVIADEFWYAPVPGGPAPERWAPPRITSVIPEPGSTVYTRSVKPTMTLTQPLAEGRLPHDVVLMLGSESGMIDGVPVYEDGLLQFRPAKGLMPGETVTVTVRARGVVNPGGARMEQDLSWTFRVAGLGEQPPAEQ